MSIENRPAIVTDSGTDIPEKDQKEHNIRVVPIKTYFDGEDITEGGTDLLLQRIAEKRGIFPTTNAPGPEQFKKVYREIFPREVISVHIGSGFSRTVESATEAADELENEGNISIFDTENASIAAGALVLYLTTSKAETKEEMIEEIRDVNKRLIFFVNLNTIELTKKGGRASKALSAVNQVLKLKPNITIGNNTTEAVFAKSRTREPAFLDIARRFQQKGPFEKLYVVHAGALSDAERLAELISPYHEKKDGEVFIYKAGPAITTHSGPKAVGAVGIRSK